MRKRTFLKLSSTLAAGAAISPMISWTQDEPLHNWAGNYVYSTRRIFSPVTVEELQEQVRKLARFKVLGTRHCFNGIADSRDAFISLAKLDPGITLNEAANTVTVSAGVRYGELADYLHQRGFALHNLASLPHISVAGACSTATHGSGVKNGNLSTAVAGMEFITAAGEIRSLSRPQNGSEFDAAVVHLGALGLVTKITLDIQPTFQVRQDVYEDLPLGQLEKHFEEIMSSGYSVSIFTNWQNKILSQVWVKSRIGESEKIIVRPDFFGAKPATRNLHPIRELSAENCTDQMGLPGPWHERLPHFKMNFTPSSGKELQSEFFVPREKAFEAIMAVEALRAKIGPLLFITELRCIDGDNFWMSPCYHRPSLAIHFTWKQEWPAVKQLLPEIEARLAPFGARPHWGKLFTMPAEQLHAQYKRLPEFLQLVKNWDPAGKFRNDFLQNWVYEVKGGIGS